MSNLIYYSCKYSLDLNNKPLILIRAYTILIDLSIRLLLCPGERLINILEKKIMKKSKQIYLCISVYYLLISYWITKKTPTYLW